MIASHINYCILVWGYEHSRIYKLQKKALRIISLSKYNAHTEPIFKKLKLLKTDDILKLNELKFYYKFENNMLPNYFQKRQSQEVNQNVQKHFILNQNNQIHQHNTRHRNNIYISRTNHTFAKKCLRHSIPYTVNSTPKCILDKIQTHSLQSYTESIKSMYINQYIESCPLINCYICNKVN